MTCRGLVLVMLGVSASGLFGCRGMGEWSAISGLTKSQYDTDGVQVGQKMPGAMVYDLDGSAIELQALWKDRPLVLVNGSFTCPISRLSCPRRQRNFTEFGDQVNVVVLYVFEPHPKTDPSPYTGDQWVTLPNRIAGIVYRQPRTLDERLVLAAKFNDHIKGETRIVVDAMDNQVWKALGGGPHTSVLVTREGVVAQKFGWHSNRKMAAAVRRLLDENSEANHPVARSRTGTGRCRFFGSTSEAR